MLRPYEPREPSDIAVCQSNLADSGSSGSYGPGVALESLQPKRCPNTSYCVEVRQILWQAVTIEGLCLCRAAEGRSQAPSQAQHTPVKRRRQDPPAGHKPSQAEITPKSTRHLHLSLPPKSLRSRSTARPFTPAASQLQGGLLRELAAAQTPFGSRPGSAAVQAAYAAGAADQYSPQIPSHRHALLCAAPNHLDRCICHAGPQSEPAQRMCVGPWHQHMQAWQVNPVMPMSVMAFIAGSCMPPHPASFYDQQCNLLVQPEATM